MKTILVDDEELQIKQFESECEGISDIDIVGKFTDPMEAIEFAKSNRVDLAFLDVEMPQMNGLELSEELKKMYPNIIIIFISAYESYMSKAFDMDADYYVLKPYNKKKVESVLDRARLLSKRLQKRVFIHTFGMFDVFVDGQPITFTSSKAKELLAYLVDRRGGVVTTEEGFSTLWEDKFYDHKNAGLYRVTLAKLKTTLENAGIPEIVNILPRGRSLNVDAVDCDYFQFLDNDTHAIESFNGEYMLNYSWGEYTCANLCQKSGFYDYTDE